MRVFNGPLQNQLLWCRRAQWGALGLLLVLTGIIYLCSIRPTDAQLNILHRRYVAAQADLRQNQERELSLPRVEMEVRRLQQRVERFDKTLPKQQDLSVFINDVTRIGQDASLKDLTWHLDSKPRRSNRLTEFPIQFTFNGDFRSGILKFLTRIEDMSRLTRVRKLKLTSTRSLDGQVNAEVTMSLYFGEE